VVGGRALGTAEQASFEFLIRRQRSAERVRQGGFLQTVLPRCRL
jgi:hypothetical protein